MQILLANDDGIHSPGLRAIHRELQQLGDVQVVAPAIEQSGVGHTVTYRSPLQVEEIFEQGQHFGWAVHGSPADCVKLGILELSPKRPDLVVSGINSGANYGINVLYSGTVAAAIEGAFFGVTSIALSLNLDSPPDYETTARRSLQLIRQLVEQFPEPGLLWSINFPPSDTEVRGVRFTSMGIKRRKEVIERRLDPRGKPYFWSGTDPLENHLMDSGSDIEALSQNHISITPLMFDLTDSTRLAPLQHQQWSCE